MRGGGQGLRLEHFSVLNGVRGLAYDTKLLHDGSASNEALLSGGAERTTVNDEIYTGTGGVDFWNATGTAVQGLKDGDTVHFVHLDGQFVCRLPRVRMKSE